jgi:hypothetical protein
MAGLCLSAAVPLFLALPGAAPVYAQARATPAPTGQEARDLAVEAYIYLYPLISMEMTRRQLTNIESGKGFGGPMNTVANIRAYPRAEDRGVVRPNFDTLYSSMFLDLTAEPVVLSVPDTGGRYYLLPMLDMWTDVFASPGWRTTGTAAANFLIVSKGWRPELRARLVEELRLPADTRVIEAPTPHVWIIGRTKTDGPADYAAVHKIQDGLKLTPASQWGKPAQAKPFTPDPSVDMKAEPKTQVDRLSTEALLALGAELMKLHPPHATDQPTIDRMRRIGLEPGKSFDPASLSPATRDAIRPAAAEAQRLLQWKLKTLARVENGWSLNTDTMGVYGNYYLKRALIAQYGLGANLPEDAIYPANLFDKDGQPLQGGTKYVIHFPRGAAPPANAFWSITLYDNEGFQIANPANKFAVSSWMPFQFNPDGSLDILVQSDDPGGEKTANWLPAPPSGPFSLTMRLYAPNSDALTGKWSPPPVEKAVRASSLAQ